MHAFEIEYDQISGLKERTELYDIQANVPNAATQEQFRTMLQNVLFNRFQMRLHRETKQMPAYELVLGKDRQKLNHFVAQDSVDEVAISNTSRGTLDSGGFPILPKRQTGYAFVNGRARLQVAGATINQLASRLSDQLEAPVIDATELAGKYDFSLYWVARSGDSVDNDGPSLFSALESQLGLRLQPRKTAVPILAIDYVNRVPTEN